MPSKIQDVVFNEPSGRRTAFVMFAGSFVMMGAYVYFSIIHDGSSISSLIMAVGFALSGFAESLPTERQRMAGGLRLTAILLLLGLIGLSLSSLLK